MHAHKRKIVTKPILLTILILFFIFPVACVHDVTLPTHWSAGMPEYGTYLSFSSQQTFDTVYRSSNTWVFDNYQFSVQNANATFTSLFSQDDILEVTLAGTNGVESTLTVNAVDAGYNYSPKSVTTGVSPSGWTWSAGTLTVLATHGVGDLAYRIDWSPQMGSGGSGSYAVEKIDTYLSILPVYANFTVYAGNETGIEGYLKTANDNPITNRTVHLSTSWATTETSQTTLDGNFLIGFTTPDTSGKHQLQLEYNGDDTYNPSTLNTPLNVVGGKEVVGVQVSIPVMFFGIFILAVVVIVVGANLWENGNKK